MKIAHQFVFERNRAGDYDEPSCCPLCKHAIKPEKLYSHTFKDNNDNWFLSFMFLCNHCFNTFVALYKCSLSDVSYNVLPTYTSTLDYVGPSRFSEEHFDDSIAELSPKFVKIYNQALAAENYMLDEIAGLGYRKALEFLVKDYCIHKNSSDKASIEALPLGKCITRYINSPQIETLTTRAAWLGNDEAHYIRKHADRDVADMKNFIKAIVHFVSMDLIVEDASSMEPM